MVSICGIMVRWVEQVILFPFKITLCISYSSHNPYGFFPSQSIAPYTGVTRRRGMLYQHNLVSLSIQIFKDRICLATRPQNGFTAFIGAISPYLESVFTK